MNDKLESNKSTIAFEITVVLLFIVFIAFLNMSSLFEDGFWPVTKVILISCCCGAVIFGLAIALMDSLFKIIVEVIVALLLFFNVVFVSLSWVFLNDFIELVQTWDLGFESTGNTVVSILCLALILFVIDLFAAIIIIPFSRISGSNVLENFS